MTRLASLLERLPGPWESEPSGLPPGGPRIWWRGPEGVALGGPPSRVAAERAGWERLGPHPARPPLLAASEDCLVVPPLGPEPDDPALVLASWPLGEPWSGRASVRDLLGQIPHRVDPGRALAGLDLKRKHIDRLLNLELAVATRLGPTFGGIWGGWMRESGRGVFALRWSLARPDGWSALDLSATGLAAGEDLRPQHREGLPPGPADALYDLCLLVRALDEAVLGHDDAAAATALELVGRLNPAAAPAEVVVALEGIPPWLDPRLWIPADGRVTAARARWLLHHLHGLSVGGHTISVRTDPAIHAGRRGPPREAQRERRRRLFSLWDQGVRADPEGLWSATPEALATALVEGMTGHVLDGTCGLGSLTLALARSPRVSKVTAVDTHAGRLDMARHNVALYGLSDRVRFVHGDVLSVLPTGAWDALVLDPPWGGPGYDRERVGLADLGLDLRAALERAPRVVRIKLPRSFVVEEITESFPGPWRVRPLLDERGVLKMLVVARD